MATPSDETDAGDPAAVEPTVDPTVDPTEEDGQRDAARAAERRDVGLLVVAGLILWVVCGAVLWNVRWDSVTVTDVLVSAEGLEIGVYGIGCDAESRAKVWEHDDSIEIRLTERPSGDDGVCASCHVVGLDGPLGARAVVDEPTGRAVPVVPISESLPC